MNDWKWAITLATCCGICLIIAASALADFVGVTTVIKDDPDTEFLCTQGNGDFVPGPLTVCNVFAVFDDPDNSLLNVGSADLQVYNGAKPDVFFQHLFNFTVTAPMCSFLGLFPDLICDTFITIGYKCGPDPAGTDHTAPDADFDHFEFAVNGHVVGGWFNASPHGSVQGVAGTWPDLQVLFLQSSVAQGLSLSGYIDLFWWDEHDGDVYAEIDVPIECAAACPDGKPCDDGDPCTENDTKCTNGVCAGKKIDCDDSNECTDDDCDPETGNCVHTPNSNDIPSETAKLTASDGDVNDRFGSSVAMSADIAVIAASEDDCGSAYVFRFQDMRWTEEAKLDGADDVCDGFANSVGISGEVIVSGARNDNEACPSHTPNCRAGAAYVYRFDGTNWVEEAKLIASDAAAQDRFGTAVAISDNVIVVSAVDDDDACPSDPHCDSGSAYVFRYNGSDWFEEAKLTASDAAQDDGFLAFAVQGDLIVAGVVHDDDACPRDPECNSGSAYVFRFDGGDWIEEAKLTASNAAQGDRFGLPTSISGNVVAIGASSTNGDSGAAYVYRFNGSDWDEEARLTASDAGQEDFFGADTFVSGDLILEGARFAGVGGQAYLYRLDGSEWIEQAILSSADSEPGDQFGRAISASNNMALVGAMRNDNDTGAVYVFSKLSGGNVTVCHIPPGNPGNAHTINIHASALPAHLAHGDTCGPCEGDNGVFLMADNGVACAADLNGDRVVNANDLALLLGTWGRVPTPAPPDFDGDGDVDASGLAQLLGAWGPCL
ncbi:MAG: hypothetical protein O7D91_08915 [Planctomycetota bacterium]|nr:hypothetical protein [Planctomycetota bacterium]